MYLKIEMIEINQQLLLYRLFLLNLKILMYLSCDLKHLIHQHLLFL
jgi:hypothetical protein